MPKREPDPEPIEEIPAEPEVPLTVGQRLRAAREEKKMRLEDIAAQTRIPQRHLECLERSEWDQLPAPTYTTGFAKSYAGAVGLDRMEIGDQLRAEMGGQRFTANTIEAFEPADPRRTMPKSLVFGTIVGLILLVALMSWLNQRSLQTPDENTTAAAAPEAAAAPAATPAPKPAAAPASGPVVLTATAPVWLQVSEKGGASLFSGMLQPGQTYAVPATATAPVLKTGKPEALRVSVGNQVAPPVGPAATTVSNVSLLGPDLMKSGAAAPTPAPPPATATAPAAKRAAPAARNPRAAVPAPAPAPTETPPATNATE